MSTVVHHSDGRRLELAADSFDVTEVGALILRRAGEPIVALPPKTWTLAYRGSENLLWHDPTPQVPADPEKPFQLPFGVIDRREVIAQRLHELGE
jgi:hypothetical protein